MSAKEFEAAIEVIESYGDWVEPMIVTIRAHVAEKDSKLTALEVAVRERDRVIAEKDARIRELEKECVFLSTLNDVRTDDTEMTARRIVALEAFKAKVLGSEKIALNYKGGRVFDVIPAGVVDDFPDEGWIKHFAVPVSAVSDEEPS